MTINANNFINFTELHIQLIADQACIVAALSQKTTPERIAYLTNFLSRKFGIAEEKSAPQLRTAYAAIHPYPQVSKKIKQLLLSRQEELFTVDR